MSKMDEKTVIIACDFNSKERLEEFLDQMEGTDPNFYCKVGMELFNTGALEGFQPVKMIKDRGHKVFLDLKLKDIPNTVAKTAAVLAKAGADIINVHADGGLTMMKKAVDSINGVYSQYEIDCQALIETNQDGINDEMIAQLEEKIKSKPILVGVTVLTSMSDEELKEEIGVDRTSMEQAVALAKLSKEAGMDGVICSPKEILAIKAACGEDFLTITPGIRFIDSKKDDQTRIATPYCANAMGTNGIVVGRPITEAEDSIASYNRCKKEFAQGIGSPEEVENAKIYIADIKKKMLEPSDAVALALIEAGAFKVNTEDPYLLKSGIASPLYCNNRALYCYPEQQKLVMNYLAELVKECYPSCEAIFGTPLSAISFGALVAERLNLKFGFRRPEQKDHGLNVEIEGPVEEGIRAVVIEDLITSGASSFQSVSELMEHNIDVLGVGGIVDNNFIDSTELVKNEIDYHTITTMSKIAHYAGEQGLITPEQYDQVLAYENNPKDESWMSEEAAEKIRIKRQNQNK